MRLLDPFPINQSKWNEYRAFHITMGKYGPNFGHYYHHAGPVVLFDTGELIVTIAEPDPDERGLYEALNIELAKSDEYMTTTSKRDAQPLYTPEGRELKKAWFPKTAWLLIDHDNGRAVPLNGSMDGRTEVHDDHRRARQGIPHRFQAKARGYIGGPGQYPVGRGEIMIRPPIKEPWVTAAQLEHATMLHTTCRAEVILSEEEGIQTAKTTEPVPWDKAMEVQHWRDLAGIHHAQLFQRGVDKPLIKYPYLLTEPPR